MLKEFKKFIARGNVLDLAVGVIIGGAFSGIVTSLVNNIFTPIIGAFFGGVDFTKLSFTLRGVPIMYGEFIQAVFDFLIKAICLFIVVKFINKFEEKIKKLDKWNKFDDIIESKPQKSSKSEEVVLLEDIRDLLIDKKKGKVKK